MNKKPNIKKQSPNPLSNRQIKKQKRKKILGNCICGKKRIEVFNKEERKTEVICSNLKCNIK